MLTLTRGELELVALLFVLTWGAGWLPRMAERLVERRAKGGAGGAREG
jgi:hypothetical protein